MKIAGVLLWILGAFVFAIGCFLPTSVAGGEFGTDRIVNMGLQQQQMIVVLAGLTLFGAGIIIHGLSVVVSAIRPEQSVKPAASNVVSSGNLPEFSQITEPTAAEVEHWREIQLFDIQRASDGHYRYGFEVFGSLRDALKAARYANR